MRFTKVFIFFMYCGLIFAQDPVTTAELKTHLTFLASDDLKGRFPGTDESAQAANYILEQFKSYGLEPFGEDGFQYFNIVTDVRLMDGNMLSIAGQNYSVEEEFIPIGFTGNDTISAQVVFAGYGFTIETDTLKWDDYAGVDVEGKWVMVLRGDPENNPHGGKYAAHSALRKKALVAKDHGAAGLIVVSGPEFDETDELMRLGFDQSRSRAGIAVIQVKRDLADGILKSTKTTIADLEKKLNADLEAASFAIDSKIDATILVEHVEVQTQNVLAVKQGSNQELKDEYIVIGAHYDHLGYGGWGSGSRNPDTMAIHNGADDNGSGVTSVLEIAEYFGGLETDRSILFMAFGAEEMGLLGSKFFTANPLVKMEDIRIMFNLDMVGRLNEEGKVTIGGTGTAEGLEDFVKEEAKKYKLHVSASSAGYGPSDHASFYIKDIPVLFFFTGTHDDYHTPSDDVDKINFDGMKEICDYVIDLVTIQATDAQQLVFSEAGSREEPRRMRFRVTLGVVPDYGSDAQGLKLDGVKQGGPADKAGIKKGDVVVSMDGKAVSNIYDYMGRLAEFKPGQQIVVEVKRGDEIIAMDVTF